MMKGLIEYYSVVYDFIKDQRNNKIYTPEEVLVSSRTQWRLWTTIYPSDSEYEGPMMISDFYLEKYKGIGSWNLWKKIPYLEMNQEEISVIEPFPSTPKKYWIEEKFNITFKKINKILKEQTLKFSKNIFGKKLHGYFPPVLILYKRSPFIPKSRIKIGLGTVEYPLLPFYRYWIYPSLNFKDKNISYVDWHKLVKFKYPTIGNKI